MEPTADGVSTTATSTTENSDPSIRQKRTRDGTHYQELLNTEKLDESGKLESRFKPRNPIKPRQPKPKLAASNADSDSSDIEFLPVPSLDENSDSEGEEEDDGDDVDITNEEIAASLPRKLVFKWKRTKGASRKSVTKKSRHNDSSENLQTHLPDSKESKKPVKMRKKTNPIYLFYKHLKEAPQGNHREGDNYYQCYHGNKHILCITKEMKHCLTGLIRHLKNNFQHLYKLYLALKQRSSPPTEDEERLASGEKPFGPSEIEKYAKELHGPGNIVDIFMQQANKAWGEWKQDHFEDLLAKWIATCDQPFDEVEKPEFQELLQYLHFHSLKPLKIPGRTTIRTRIMKMGEDTIELTKEMFKKLMSKISISLDAWTSSNQIVFLAIVAHYVNNDGELEELLIDFWELVGQHSGENLADAVWKTFELYGIQDSILAVMMDNASNNDTLMQSLEERCKEASIDFDAKFSRLRCMPHTIHLAAIKLLECIGALLMTDSERARGKSGVYQDTVTESLDAEVDNEATLQEQDQDPSDMVVEAINVGAVNKLRNIIRGVQSSPQCRASWLKEVQILSGITELNDSADGAKYERERPLMLILDVKTRWSSTHQMLRRALKFQEVIDSFVTHPAHREFFGKFELDTIEWNTIRLVANWLESFRSATTQMSITKMPMLSQTGAIFQGLQEMVKNAIRDLPPSAPSKLRDGLVAAHLKLSEYYERFDESPLHTWAALLDPRISYEGLKSDFHDDATLLTYLENVKKQLEDYFQKNYVSRDPNNSNFSTPSTSISMPVTGNSSTGSFTSRYSRKPRAAEDELSDYFKLPPEDFDSCSPLEWWFSRRYQFPALYRLACDLFGIPGSAVVVERIFSGGCDTISIRRASLKPETIRNLMIVKHHCKLHRGDSA